MAQVRVEVEDVVVGDLLVPNAGDVVSADCLVVRSQGLLSTRRRLTGESCPAEKRPGVVDAATSLAGRSCSLFCAPTWSVMPVRRSWEDRAGDAVRGGVRPLGVRRPRTGFERASPRSACC